MWSFYLVRWKSTEQFFEQCPQCMVGLVSSLSIGLIHLCLPLSVKIHEQILYSNYSSYIIIFFFIKEFIFHQINFLFLKLKNITCTYIQLWLLAYLHLPHMQYTCIKRYPKGLIINIQLVTVNFVTHITLQKHEKKVFSLQRQNFNLLRRLDRFSEYWSLQQCWKRVESSPGYILQH